MWGVVIAIMVVGLVGAYAVLAQGAFRLDELAASQEQLLRDNEQLQLQVERHSTSGQIARWAEQHHMVLPDVVEIITPPSPRGPDRASRGSTGGAV